MQSYEKRHERLIGGPESYLNIKKTESDLELHDFIDSDPLMKAKSQIEKLATKGILPMKIFLMPTLKQILDKTIC